MNLADFLGIALSEWEIQVMIRLTFDQEVDASAVFGGKIALKLQDLQNILSTFSDIWREELCVSAVLNCSNRTYSDGRTAVKSLTGI